MEIGAIAGGFAGGLSYGMAKGYVGAKGAYISRGLAKEHIFSIESGVHGSPEYIETMARAIAQGELDPTAEGTDVAGFRRGRDVIVSQGRHRFAAAYLLSQRGQPQYLNAMMEYARTSAAFGSEAVQYSRFSLFNQVGNAGLAGIGLPAAASTRRFIP
jgi:hypothetical protein